MLAFSSWSRKFWFFTCSGVIGATDLDVFFADVVLEVEHDLSVVRRDHGQFWLLTFLEKT